MAKKKDEVIKINRKAAIGIVALMPLTGIIVSRGDVGALMLLILCTVVGIYIGKNL